jgi:hypothetical protein
MGSVGGEVSIFSIFRPGCGTHQTGSRATVSRAFRPVNPVSALSGQAIMKKNK